MTRISVARHMVGEDINVHVSGELKPGDETGIVSAIGESVELRVKPDRRSVDMVMPAGTDRRRTSQ